MSFFGTRNIIELYPVLTSAGFTKPSFKSSVSCSLTVFDTFLLRRGCQQKIERLIFRLAVTSDLFETLPECRSLESSIITYNCNFKGNGYLVYFI